MKQINKFFWKVRLRLLLGPILFGRCKMNKTIDKFLLGGDKFMPEMYLRQPGFTYSEDKIDHLLKTKKEYKNLKKQEINDILIKTR